MKLTAAQVRALKEAIRFRVAWSGVNNRASIHPNTRNSLERCGLIEKVFAAFMDGCAGDQVRVTEAGHKALAMLRHSENNKP